MLAVPVETVTRDDLSIARLSVLAQEYEPMEFVIGLPINMRGEDTESTADSRRFATELVEATGIPAILVDERLSTVSAHAALRASGRTQRGSRGIVDQVAAVVLLQHAIDTEKRTGYPAGERVSLDEETP